MYSLDNRKLLSVENYVVFSARASPKAFEDIFSIPVKFQKNKNQ